ncbi:hypothetical protein [Microbacterium gubbeenense]|uniref:hypothetical protein n=1 Tax=Microbacterium gubbeenense TaxID=159896 RepID=UPI003F9857AA
MTDAALHASDSSEQRAAEIAIIAAVSEIVAVPLAPARIAIGEARVEIDGASEDRSVLVEAYARVGALRGGQPKKLATDAFKLAWAGEKLGAQRLIIAIVGDEADAYLRRPGAWLTAALHDAKIEVIHVPLTADIRDSLTQAQARQYR